MRIIQTLYNDCTCSGLHNVNLLYNQESNEDACLTMLDWIMKETTKNDRTGIRWTLNTARKSRFCRRHLPCVKHKNHRPKMKIGIKKTNYVTIGESPNPTIKIDGGRKLNRTRTVDLFSHGATVILCNFLKNQFCRQRKNSFAGRARLN